MYHFNLHMLFYDFLNNKLLKCINKNIQKNISTINLEEFKKSIHPNCVKSNLAFNHNHYFQSNLKIMIMLAICHIFTATVLLKYRF